MTRPFSPITTERLVLRPFTSADLPDFVAYRRDPSVARYQGWHTTYAMEDAVRFLASQEEVEFGRPGPWVQLAAVDRLTDELVGDCASHVTLEPPATAEIGITLAPVHQGRGLAREVVRGLVTTLFARHGIHRVMAQADDRNQSVHRLFEALAFRCEARLVEADWFKGEWTSLRIYAVLDHEWRAPPRT